MSSCGTYRSTHKHVYTHKKISLRSLGMTSSVGCCHGDEISAPEDSTVCFTSRCHAVSTPTTPEEGVYCVTSFMRTRSTLWCWQCRWSSTVSNRLWEMASAQKRQCLNKCCSSLSCVSKLPHRKKSGWKSSLWAILTVSSNVSHRFWSSGVESHRNWPRVAIVEVHTQNVCFLGAQWPKTFTTQYDWNASSLILGAWIPLCFSEIEKPVN